MAPRMKLWIGNVAAACIGATLMVPAVMPDLPWDSPAGVARITPEASARLEAVAVASALQRLRWLDSIDARWDQASREGVMLGFDDPDAADELRDSARALLSSMEEGASRVGYAAVRTDWLLPESRHVKRLQRTFRPIHLLDPVSGRCVVVQAEDSGRSLQRTAAQLGQDGRSLGPCAWVARYGPPGDSVRAWLARGGSAFAARTTVPGDRILLTTSGGARGYPSHPDPLLRVPEERCIYGDDAACITMFVEPGRRIVPPSPAVQNDPAISRTPARRALGGVGAGLLAELEREVGSERFAAFWRSDEPLPAALAEATGRRADEWLGEWARSKVEGPVARAGPRPLDAVITLLVLALLGAVAVAVAARRRAG